MVVIDMGSLIYRAAITNETDDLGISKKYIISYIDFILDKTNSNEFIMCMDSHIIWKKLMIKSYKSDRPSTHIKFRNEIHQWLLSEGGTCITGLEADDLCGIASTKYKDVIIAHIDSDLNLLKCKHFNYDKPELGVYEYPYEPILEKSIICGSHNNNKGLSRFGQGTFDKVFDDFVTFGDILNTFISGVEKDTEKGIKTVQGLGNLFGNIEYYKNFIQSYVLQHEEEALMLLNKLGINVEINFNIMKKGNLVYGGQTIKF